MFDPWPWNFSQSLIIYPSSWNNWSMIIQKRSGDISEIFHYKHSQIKKKTSANLLNMWHATSTKSMAKPWWKLQPNCTIRYEHDKILRRIIMSIDVLFYDNDGCKYYHHDCLRRGDWNSTQIKRHKIPSFFFF